MLKMGKRTKEIVQKIPLLQLAANMAYDLGYGLLGLVERRHPVEEDLIIFESYMGRKYSCSPRAIFEALERLERKAGMPRFRKIWAFEKPEEYQYLQKEYPGTMLVKYGSKEYYACYAKARYWVTNYVLQPGISKKRGQTYVQTWHGTPLKKIAFDVPRTSYNWMTRLRLSYRYRKESRMIDYMVSPSPFYSKVVRRAFRLRKNARMLEEGYPRNDSLFLEADNADYLRSIKKKIGIPENKKVILYAPTWRSGSYDFVNGHYFQAGSIFEDLKKSLQDSAVVLYRTHYFITRSQDPSMEGFVYDVSAYDEVNDLYLISDLLITDYSSVFFDFANLERPILFYMFDYESYREEMHNFYFDIRHLPGPVIREKRDISPEVKELLEKDFAPDRKYRKFNQVFNPIRRACGEETAREIFYEQNSRLAGSEMETHDGKNTDNFSRSL